jgi:hypothetical protein
MDRAGATDHTRRRESNPDCSPATPTDAVTAVSVGASFAEYPYMITITIDCPHLERVLALLESNLAAPMVYGESISTTAMQTVAEPAAMAPSLDPAEAEPVKRGPGRPRKSPPTVAKAQAQAKAAGPTPVLATVEELRLAVADAVARVGVDAVRGVLQQFKVTRATELPAEVRGAFIAVLGATQAVVE